MSNFCSSGLDVCTELKVLYDDVVAEAHPEPWDELAAALDAALVRGDLFAEFETTAR